MNPKCQPCTVNVNLEPYISNLSPTKLSCSWRSLLPQGTYLAASVQGDLDAMIEHKEPAAAGAHIRALHRTLHAYWREIIGSSSTDLRVRSKIRFRM